MLPKKKRWMADVVHPSPSNLVSLPTPPPPPTTTITLPNVSNNDGAKKIHCCDTPIQTMNTNTSTRSLPLPISSSSSPQLPPSGKSLQGGNLMSSSDMYGIAVLQQQQQRQTNHPQQQTFNNRPGSNTTEHSQSDKSQTLTSRQSNHSMKSTPSGRRNDVNANLITTISQYPTELLQQQQPGLLLQVLPQEYLMNYAQNLAKLNANKNSSSETVHTSVNECSVIPSKLNKIDNTSLANITAYSQGLLHQSSDTQGRQTHTTLTTTSTNMSNPSLRIKCSENSKIQRTPPQPTLRSSPMHNSPVFQYPAPTNSQRFSPPPPPPGPAPSQPSQTTSHPPPPRRLSGGSGDQVRHMKPMMTQSHHQHHHQLPPGFDLSSISAVARAASMLSPSQLEAAAALLSQWDNANHLSLLANNPSYRNLCNIAELSGNNKQQLANSSSSSVVSYASSIPSEINPVSSSCYMDNNPIQGVNRSGMTTEAKTRRVSDISSSSSSFVNPKTVPSVSIGTMSDLRYSNMKTSPSLPRSMESTNRLNSRSSTPVNEMHKSEQHICCPPWITASGTGTGTGSGSASAGPGGSGASTDQRTYPTDSSHPNKLQPNPRDRDHHHHHQQTVELADSRLAILHDAKLASLSVDWPSCTMSQNNNNNNNNNMPMMSKANRIRSSSSSSSSFSSTAACQAVSSLSSTPESSPFSVVNQLATKTVERKYSSSTSSSSPLSSGSSFLPSESMHKTSISGQCSPNVPMTFNFKGLNPHLQTSSSSPVSVSSTSSLSSSLSSCCQTIKPPPSPVIGGHKIPSSTITQSQIVITYSEENSPITTTTTTTTTNTACSPQSLNSFFPIMNTNSTTTSTNNVIEIAGSSSSCKVEVDDRSSINWSGKRSTHQSSELNNNNKRQSTTAYSSSGGLLPSTPPIQIMKQDSIIKNKINDNNSLDQKTQNNNNNNTSMPLKKRLIQRYEADRDIDMKQPSEVKNMCSSSTKIELTMESAKVQSRPISYSEDMKANHYLSENRLTTKENVEKIDCSERKFKQKKRSKYGTTGGILGLRNDECSKPTKITPTTTTKSALNNCKKSAPKISRRSKQLPLCEDDGAATASADHVDDVDDGDDDGEDDEDEDDESHLNVKLNTLQPEYNDGDHDHGHLDKEKLFKTRRPAERRSRKHNSPSVNNNNNNSSLSHTSLRNDTSKKRRLAAVNGNLMMMVTAHAQRSTSSGSNSSTSTTTGGSRSRSSSSLRSVEGGTGAPAGSGGGGDCSDNDAYRHSSSSSSTIQSKNSTDRQLPYSRMTSYNKSNHLKDIMTMNSCNHLLTPSGGSPTGTHSSIDSTHGGGVGSTSGGSRKPKRTAALAASIATSVSTVKKPRLSSSSSSSSSKHRNDTGKGKNRYKDNPHNHNADDVDDNDIGDESSSHGCIDVKEESTDQDDVISIISGNSCEQPMPNELSAALAEENLQFEELAKQLPGPPDLNRTANKSLHSTHSLNFYKRSQRVFVQLISCSDVGLKQVPKCRACRHARVTYHNSPSNCINGVDDSDDDYSESKHALFNQDVNSSSNDDQNSYSDESRKVGQFKRPPPGRSSSSSVSEKNRQKERTTTEKLLKDNKRNVTHHSPSPVSVFCRFWGFRKLCYNNRGVLKIADFCRSTESDALERSLWEMYHPVSPFLSAYAARYILECAGGLFCRLLHQELTSLNGNNSNHIEFQKITSLSGRNGKSSNTNAVNKNDDNNNHNNNNGGGDNTNLIAWKKPVKGVREMCDVCDTTMFNTHWVCAKCGYSVCTDCLDESKLTNSSMNSDRKVNENGTVVEKSKSKHSRGRGGGPHGWASCTTTRQHHDPNRLLLTSLLPSGIIGRLIHRLHRIANYHQINLGCHCSASAAGSSASLSSTSSSESSGGADVSLKSTKTLDVVRGDGVDRNSLDLLADIALKTDESNSTPTATTITSTTTTTTMTPSTTTHNSPNSTTTTTTTTNDTDVSTANRIIDSTTPPMMDNGGIKLVVNNDNKNNNHNKRISNIPSHNWIHSRNSTGQKSCQKMNELTNHHHHNNNTNSNSNNGSDLHKDLDVVKSYQTKQVNHLHHLQQSHQHQNRHPAVLRLHHPDLPGVLLQFQSEWRHNHPLVISGCQRKFNQELWTPQSFSDDFGELKTTLVDCATGAEITRYCLKSFWDGFERHERRITSKDGRALCLKLKDWPTTDDFAELQPKRFSDLMSNLPMPDYTRRDGQLNLAARLASFFVCPDLGPKLYVAYGTVGSNAVSTTNLHVDIADAVNVMLCVGQPIDSSKDMLTNAENVLNTLKCSRVDNSYLDRTVSWLNRLKSCHNNNNNNNREFGFDDVPGALWHIFLPEDSVVLREFLSRVSEEETGSPVESGSDPIHDQLFYLDQSLLDRLYDYAGIQPCTIVQFLGDAVFIPAGAAHQVRNLNSCIKAAVDFVSPEHLPQCFQLLEEFRQLSPNHLNREDKLQIKNMLFHGIKDALSVLLTTNSNSNGSNENEVKCYKSLTMDSEHKLSQCTTTKIDGIDHRQDNVDNRSLPSSDMSDIKVNIKSEYLHNNNNNNNGNSNTNVMKSSNHNSRNGGNNGGGRTRGRPGGGGAAAAAGGGRSKAPSSSSDLINPPLAPPPPSAPHLHPQSFTSSSVSSMSSSCSSISNAFSSVFTPGIDNSLLTNSLNIPSRDSMCTASSPASLSTSSEKIMKSGDIIKPNNNNNLMITTHPSNNYDCDRIPPITTTTTTNISSSTCSPSPSTTTLSSSPDILHIPASSSCFTSSSSSSSLLPSLSCGSLSCQHHLQHQQHPHHCQQPQHQNGCTGHFS